MKYITKILNHTKIGYLFSVSPENKDVPKILFPIQNYVCGDPQVHFSWTGTPGTYYIIEIATSPDFGASIVETAMVDINKYTANYLQHSATYFVRVREDLSQAWSDIVRFKILGTTILISPDDDVIVNSLNTLFSWEQAQHVSYYILEFSRNSNFDIIEWSMNVTDTSITLNSIPIDGHYYWRVVPFGSERGVPSNFHSIEIFNHRTCLLFDGVNDYAVIPDSSIFRLNEGAGGKQMTWNIWVHPINHNNIGRGIFHKGMDSTNNREYQLNWDNNGALFFVVFGDASGMIQLSRVTANNVIINGEYYMITVTYNGDTSIKIYVNGIRRDITNANSGSFTQPWASNFNITFGKSFWSGGAKFFPGKLDEFAIFDKELTPTEILTLYNSGNGRDAMIYGSNPNIVGYWKFNENTGMISVDKTGRENNLTLRPAPETPSWSNWV